MRFENCRHSRRKFEQCDPQGSVCGGSGSGFEKRYGNRNNPPIGEHDSRRISNHRSGVDDRFESHQITGHSYRKEPVATVYSCDILAGAEIVHTREYPGWRPNEKSEILHIVKSVFNNRFGKTPKVQLVHGGLECGVIGDIYRGMDMISFGPDIKEMHSPNEKVSISSVEKLWELLKDVLKAIPQK